MGLFPPRHLGVVAIEKGNLGSPLITVANFTYFFIRLINGAQRGSTNPDHSETGSNGKNEYSTLPRSPEVEPHNQMKFSIIPWTPFLWWSLYPSAGDGVSVLYALSTGQKVKKMSGLTSGNKLPIYIYFHASVPEVNAWSRSRFRFVFAI